MLFNSFEFLLFLPIVLIVYAVFKRARPGFLLLSSYFFYGWWNWSYLILIIASSLVDYISSIQISNTENQRRSKFFLTLSVAVNLGILFSFKYFNFFVGEFNKLLEILSMDYLVPHTDLLLPMGISFYTFQSLSYTIDVFNRKIPSERKPIPFFLYVSFFPQLVAGPIERAGNLLGQLNNLKDIEWKNINSGLAKTSIGFFKKLVIADRIAPFVNQVYDSPDQYDGFFLILATVLFAFQIYCDFSGYSDIAIGVARMFGVRLMENFNSPYFASNIRDFWGRWHISLSTWFKDYVYIPLGGNRRKLVRNVFITFLVSGIWHGANWTFAVWGALHGFYLIATIILVKHIAFKGKLGSFISIVFTFALVVFAWIFFRANSIGDAYLIITKIGDFNINYIKDVVYQIIAVFGNAQTFLRPLNLNYGEFIFDFSIGDIWLLMLSIPAMLFFEFQLQKDKTREMPPWGTAVFLVLILLFGTFSKNQFIYFQF